MNQLWKFYNLNSRDFTFRGLSDTVKAGGNHFNPLVRQAASRIQVVFDHYGNLTLKSYDEETAAINALISDLNSNNAADVTTLGISGWLTELQANNTAFDTLMKSRYSQEAAKTQLRMKQVRLELDAAYRIITNRINALIIVNGDAAYKAFVDELNQRIERYGNNMSIRSGRNAKDDLFSEGVTSSHPLTYGDTCRKLN
ncbi:MAG: DUF6261 family protein [Bacteroidia bacterium]|nr:DUF6261 family protein [Bacteroidia bacterium]